MINIKKIVGIKENETFTSNKLSKFIIRDKK